MSKARGQSNMTDADAKVAAAVMKKLTLGVCPLCSHRTYALDVAEFCPCEGCHPGGAVVRRLQ